LYAINWPKAKRQCHRKGKKDNMNKTAKIGLLFVSLCILIISVVIFVKQITKEPTYCLNVLFQDIGTLTAEDRVSIQGVNAGKVVDIDLNDSLPLVKIELPHALQIPLGSSFEIVNIGLFGEKKIHIRLSNSAKFHNDNDTITGTYSAPPSIGEAISNMTTQVVTSAKLDSIIFLLNTQNAMVQELLKQKK
jgi:ABC-type transporter Mla subunit MlaD